MSVEAMRQALLDKRAETLENNKTQSGEAHVYPPLPDRGAGTLSAPWGEKPHPDPTHNSTSVWEQSLEDRPKMLARLFDEMTSSSAADKSYVNEHFDTRGYESHSPLLQKAASHEPPPTLGERVRSLIGR